MVLRCTDPKQWRTVAACFYLVKLFYGFPPNCYVFKMQLMVAATLVLLCSRPLEVGMFGQLPWLLTVPSIAIIGREVRILSLHQYPNLTIEVLVLCILWTSYEYETFIQAYSVVWILVHCYAGVSMNLLKLVGYWILSVSTDSLGL